MVTSRHRFSRRTPQPSEDGLTPKLAGYGPAAQAMSAVETVQEANEAEAKVKLYDMVDHTWTAPISEFFARSFHLQKVVYVCSGCRWSSTWPNQFEPHKKQARMDYNLHTKAEVVSASTVNGTAFRCTGCNSSFQFPARAQMHIESVKRQNGGHDKATLILSRRFALEPPVTPVASAASVAVASQSERVEGPRKRKRRHHRGARNAYAG